MASPTVWTGDDGGHKGDAGRQEGTRRADDFPQQLARLREHAGWTLDELSDQSRYNRSYLHKLETGERPGSSEVIKTLDRVYGLKDVLFWAWEQGKNGAFLDRFSRFMDLESRATMMQKYSASVIPGLVQTEEYAYAQLKTARYRDSHALAEQLDARMKRQAILHGDNAPDLRIILDESAVFRRLPDTTGWVAQLKHLLELSDQQNMTIQLLPFSAGLQHLLGGSLTILWLPDGSSVAYEESSTTGNLIEEPGEVEQLRLSYDRLRDESLSPQKTASHIQRIMEEAQRCQSPDPT